MPTPLSTAKVLRVIALSIALTTPTVALAEIIQLNGMHGAVQLEQNTPTRGMSKTAVLKKFGKPSSEESAVGKPPVSTWQYPNFTVYFEKNAVIHTVLH